MLPVAANLSGIEIDRADSRLQNGCPQPNLAPGDHPKVVAAVLAQSLGECRDLYGDLLEHDNAIVDNFSTRPDRTAADVTNQ